MAKYLEGTDAQKSRAYSPAVITEGGRIVWLAGQTAVLKGVHIGDNSIVGFRGVVTSDVPPNVIVAGDPARVIKQLDLPKTPSEILEVRTEIPSN